MLSLPAPAPQPPAPIFSGASTIEDRRRELLRAWLGGLKPATVRAYQRQAAVFADWAQAPSPDAAVSWFFAMDGGSANHAALRFRQHLEGLALAPASIAQAMNALKSLARLARTFGLCSWKIEIQSPRVIPYRDATGPGEANWIRMKRQAETDATPIGVRDLALVRLAFALALRRAELAGLRMEDLELQDGAPVAVWIMGKGRSERERLTIPPGAAAALATWLRIRGDDEGGSPIFFRMDKAATTEKRPLTGEGIRVIIARLGHRAGVEKTVRPHGLRHTSAGVAWRKTKDIMGVRDHLRHESIATTQIYIDAIEDSAGRMAAIVDAD